MEADRFGQGGKYYIIGLMCLCVGLVLFVTSFYSFPYLVFKWRYSIPEIVSNFSGFLQISYHLKEKAAGWLVFLFMFFPAIICFVIADILANKIDSNLYRNKHARQNKNVMNESNVVTEDESKGLVFKIIMVVILVFIVSQFFHWAISTTPPT